DDHFGAKRPERVDLLLGLLVGRGEDALVAFHDRSDGEAHAGIAGGAFDDRAAGFEQTGFLRVLDHLHRHAILDRVARIESLDFRQHRGVDEAARDPVDAHHRRVADCVEDGVAYLLVDGRGVHGPVYRHTPRARRTAMSSPMWWALWSIIS